MRQMRDKRCEHILKKMSSGLKKKTFFFDHPIVYIHKIQIFVSINEIVGKEI